jgi:hypothetical protein
MDSRMEESQAVAQEPLGGDARGAARKWRPRGRRAAPAPDFAPIPGKLTALVRQRLPFVSRMFNALPDPRGEDYCLYAAATVLWMVVLGFLCRHASRNAMDAARNAGATPENLFALSGQDRWPRGRPRTAPCTQTATRLLDILQPGKLEEVLVAVARELLRAKLLDPARFRGRVLLLVDGTKQEPYRKGWAPWRRNYRYVLHLKLLGPCGTAFTVMAEPVDAYDTERKKLDCEREAFGRIVRRFKEAFPRLEVCVLGDAIFACEPVFRLCGELGWKFVFTFKEGSHPAVWEEALELLRQNPRNAVRMAGDDAPGSEAGDLPGPKAYRHPATEGFLQDTRWLRGVPFGKRDLDVVFQGEVRGTTEFFGAWVTDFAVLDGADARGVAAAGRSRSRIEETYNVQKNGGFGLEHAFRATDRGAANYHLLMQLAHNLWQLLAKGLLHREFAACRKLTDLCLADLLRTALRACAPPAEPLPAFQLRFADG